MDRVPSQDAKNPPNLVSAGPSTLDRLMAHIDPGNAEESEEFVQHIYEQRRSDLSSDRHNQTRRR